MLTLHHTLAQQHPAAAAALAAAEATQQQQQQPGNKSKRSRSAAGLDADGEQQQQQPAAVRYTGSCRTADGAWSAVDAAIANLAGFRDASLDKWHRRTVLSSGTAALRGSSGLRALQQSVSSQVAALMSDKAKLVARSQLPAELAPRPLGTPAADHAQPGSDDDEGDDEGRRPAAAGAAGRRERARDAETYDEGDFYQQLLKELLDSGGGLERVSALPCAVCLLCHAEHGMCQPGDEFGKQHSVGCAWEQPLFVHGPACYGLLP
jgi:protein AATF/BFR2